MRNRSSWRGALVAFAITAIAASVPSLLFAASNYGDGTYGGGAYGQGEVPAVTPAPATSGGGGGVISGPLSVGYSAEATTTTVGSTTINISGGQVTTQATSSAISGGQAPTQATSSAPATSYQFEHSLQYFDRGQDVLYLQQFLNNHGSPLTSAGDGSPGNETDFFGALTYRALIRFQDNHPAEILNPNGLSAGTGFFGPTTRAYINALSN